jgi:hypothetical protein
MLREDAFEEYIQGILDNENSQARKKKYEPEKTKIDFLMDLASVPAFDEYLRRLFNREIVVPKINGKLDEKVENEKFEIMIPKTRMQLSPIALIKNLDLTPEKLKERYKKRKKKREVSSEIDK